MDTKFNSFIFDLDGTLLNSLPDISSAVNCVLQRFGLPTHIEDSYKYFVGNGIKVLAEKSLPKNFDMNQFSDFLREVEIEYTARQVQSTIPYNGVMELLTSLNLSNIPISILSNKPDDITQTVVKYFFPSIHFHVVFGARANVARKPDPQAVFEIIDRIGLAASDFAFVGDTATDIQTGKNAGLKVFGVSWGFRTVDELINAGADMIIDKPSQLLKYCL